MYCAGTQGITGGQGYGSQGITGGQGYGNTQGSGLGANQGVKDLWHSSTALIQD